MEKYKVEIKWSLIFAVVYFLWLFLEKYLGYHSEKALHEQIFNLLFVPIFILIYFLALKEKKKEILNNEMSWKDGFGCGLILTLLISITSTFVVFVFFTYVSPDFFETAISMSKKKEIAQINYNLQVFVKNNIFDKLSFGIVFTSLISYFIKTK